MVAEVLTRYAINARIPPESPIEDLVSRMLDGGASLGTRTGYLEARTWEEGLRLVEASPELSLRHELFVFPQVRVRHFRPDFMVAVRPRRRRPEVPWDAFFVECDGARHHSALAHAMADLGRETSIKGVTGMDTLRFSGAEIVYRADQVAQVLGARIETSAAVQECGGEAFPAGLLDEVWRAVATLARHPALRRPYWAGNRPASTEDPYDPDDPLGENPRSTADADAAEWDSFHRLRALVARVRHAVAAHRLEGPIQRGVEGTGQLRSLGDVLTSLLARVA